MSNTDVTPTHSTSIVPSKGNSDKPPPSLTTLPQSPDSGYRSMFGQHQRPTLAGIAAQILELPHTKMMDWARDLKAASNHVGSNEYAIAENITEWCERTVKEAGPV